MLLGLNLTQSFEFHLGSFARGDNNFKKPHKVHFTPAARLILLISNCALSGANFHQVMNQVSLRCLCQTALSNPEHAIFLGAISTCTRPSTS